MEVADESEDEGLSVLAFQSWSFVSYSSFSARSIVLMIIAT